MRLRLTSAVLLAVLLGAVTSTGCGKKPRPVDGEVAETPAPAMPITTLPPVKAVTPPRVPPVIPDASTPPAPTPEPAQPVLPMGLVVPPPVDPMPMTGQPPVVPMANQPPVVPPSTPMVPPITVVPKDPPREPTKPKDAKEFEWPKEINGRDVMAFMKDCSDPDPAMREVGLRTLPNFGPSVKKLVDKDGKNLFAKSVLSRMDFDKEKDTGVRTAAYATAAVMGFEDVGDTKEAVRQLCIGIDKGVTGGSGRQHAVQALAAFGPKAEGAINVLVGAPITDVSYETRRSIAFTLGKIGANETTGPNARALTCLTSVLAADPSAVVRLEALQSLAILGPPWEGTHAAADKTPPKLDRVGITAHVAVLKKRLAPAPPGKGEKTSSGLVERDKQVEMWVRLVLMRFEAKEINDENLGAIAKGISHAEQGPRIQALAILGMMGEIGARKIDDIVKALGADDLLVVQAAINALATLGVNAKPALPELRKLTTHKDEGVKKMAIDAVKFITDAKTPAEMQKKP